MVLGRASVKFSKLRMGKEDINKKREKREYLMNIKEEKNFFFHTLEGNSKERVLKIFKITTASTGQYTLSLRGYFNG